MITRYLTLVVLMLSIALAISPLSDNKYPGNHSQSESPDDPLTPDTSIYWGAYIHGAPFQVDILESFEKRLNKEVSILHWGQPWMMNWKPQKFQTAEFEKVRQHGSIPMLNWGSWHLGLGQQQADYQLQDIYSGRYDAYIRQWASDAKTWGYPFFLRFNHEMNGWWFPWAEQINGNSPGDYVKAWRHVHDLFQQVGATNVSWVWSVNIEGEKTTPLLGLYPGDEYVDWVAFDGYNAGPSEEFVWKSFTEIFKPTYDKMKEIAPGKPVMISEFASAEYTGAPNTSRSKAIWIQDALATQLPLYFPEVKAIVWFNWDDGDSRRTWPVESSTAATEAFAKAISSSYYASDDFLCVDGTPISILETQPEPENGLTFGIYTALNRLYLPFIKTPGVPGAPESPGSSGC